MSHSELFEKQSVPGGIRGGLQTYDAICTHREDRTTFDKNWKALSAKTVFSQQEILKKLRPLLESEGTIYHKKRNILAKKAKGGERIETVTGDGVETINEAGPGDYIVQNQTEAGEQYVVPENEFLKKYAPVGKPSRQGFAEYRSTGKIVALELTAEKLKALGLPREFKFKTDWGEYMVAKAGDFMGGPADFSEVYRLARKEFFETYMK